MGGGALIQYFGTTQHFNIINKLIGYFSIGLYNLDVLSWRDNS